MPSENQLFTEDYKDYKSSPTVVLKTRFVALSDNFHVVARSHTYYGAYAKAYLKGVLSPYIVNETCLHTR